MKIIPLSEKYLDDAILLCNKVFPDDKETENPPELGFRASLHREQYKEYWEKYGCTRIEYFLLLNENDDVVGTTGLYEKADPTTAWLGWFCVDPNQRGKGAGSELLEYSIERARMFGYKYLVLYTNPEESQEAQRLYNKFGFLFEKTGANPGNKDEQVIYLKKKL